MRVVVVGSGPAGLRVAERVAAAHHVLLFGEEPGVPYNRVALSNWLAGDVEADSLLTPAGNGAIHRDGRRIAAIDRDRRRVVTGDGDAVGYDRLVLATGSDARRPDLPGADLPHVVAYRTRHDVARMLAAAEAGGSAVVIGGGLLGLEAATGLARRGMRVSVLHATGRVLDRQLDAHASGLLERRIRHRGIAIVTDARIERITPDAVELADGRRVPAGLVVLAIGIVPRTELARDAGLEVGRGIVVDDAMRSSDPAILACGECAEHDGVCVGLAGPALVQADTAASTILQTGRSYRSVADAATLKVAGEAVWSGGRLPDAADDPDAAIGTEDIVIEDGSRSYRRLVLQDGRLVGAVMVGDTADAAWFHRLIADRRDVAPMRAALAFGPAWVETEDA